MIVLVSRFEGKNRGWWQEMGQWAFDLCKAFLKYNTKLSADTTGRVVRLGLCRGGWSARRRRSRRPPTSASSASSCSTSSTTSAARCTRCRRRRRCGTTHIEADAIAPQGRADLDFTACSAAQSNTTGLFVNWVEPSDTDLRSGAKTSKACADETPPAEFGAQAARRVAPFLDEAWFGEGPATELLRPLTLHVASKLRFADERCTQVSCNAELGLDEGGLVTAIFPSWTEEPFITGPVAAALTVPAEGSDGFEYQQAALTTLGRLVHQQHYTAWKEGWDADGVRWATLALLSLGPDHPSVGATLHGREHVMTRDKKTNVEKEGWRWRARGRRTRRPTRRRRRRRHCRRRRRRRRRQCRRRPAAAAGAPRRHVARGDGESRRGDRGQLSGGGHLPHRRRVRDALRSHDGVPRVLVPHGRADGCRLPPVLPRGPVRARELARPDDDDGLCRTHDLGSACSHPPRSLTRRRTSAQRAGATRPRRRPLRVLQVLGVRIGPFPPPFRRRRRHRRRRRRRRRSRRARRARRRRPRGRRCARWGSTRRSP